MGSGVSKVKLPITLHEVKVEAPLRIVMEFFPQSPFLKVLDVNFRVVPPNWLSFSIKIMGALNLLSLPGIKAWVSAQLEQLVGVSQIACLPQVLDTITAAVKQSMEELKKITVRLAEDEEAEVRGQGAKPELKAEVPVVPLKQGERNVFKRYKVRAGNVLHAVEDTDAGHRVTSR